MKKSMIALCVICACGFALDYSFGGRAEAFGKFSFNDGKANEADSINPSDSYASMFGALEWAVREGGLELALGGALNTLAYDSTTAQGGTSLGNGYVGAWWGYRGNEGLETRRYILHNASIGFENSLFSFKAGRYETQGLDWFNAWNEGIQVRINPINGSSWHLAAWGFYSNARAMVYNNWFWDYTRFSLAGEALGAGGVDLTFNTESTQTQFSAYGYYVPHRFSAPGVKLWLKILTHQFEAIGLFPRNALNPTWYDGTQITQDTILGNKFDRSTQTLFLKYQYGDDEQDNFYAGAMFYKNWGNANAWIGTYGDPFGGIVDIWTGSAYDKGASLSDIVGRNATSGMLYVGGVNYDINWQLLGRLTTSPRSDEQSIALTLTKEIIKDLRFRIKIEYFNDTTKAGYAVGNSPVLSQNQTNDRSHIMTWLLHTF
ncbi:hypothetical protein LS71_006025 [Helicobacter jaachi]|uniref:Outer membrane family protein n=1 Tax=Helicobacter jaachi TaxID=1677920 RepID=A0A4V6I2L5_9HELI|nr:outer membrane family protein [Helicobacter jaachi]TLD96612.1 hypothetical protein LS71_006025 [Helicobacter jaachi]